MYSIRRVILPSVFPLAIAAGGLFCIPATWAQQHGSTGPSATRQAAVAELQTRIQQVSEQINSAAVAASAQPPEAGAADFQAKTARLRELKTLYERRLSARSQMDQLEDQGVRLEEETQSFASLPERPPYTITYLDGLRDMLDAQLLEHEADLSVLDQAVEELRNAEKRLGEANKALRERQGSLDANQQLDQVVAEAAVALQQDLSALAKLDADLSEKSVDFAKRKVGLGLAGLAFTAEELAEKKQAVEKVRSEIETKLLPKARAANEEDRARLTRAKKALDAAADDDTLARGRNTLEVRETEAAISTRSVSLLEELSAYLDDEIKLWDIRYQVLSRNPNAILGEIATEVHDLMVRVGQKRQALESRLNVLRSGMNELRQRLDEVGLVEGGRTDMEKQKSAYVAGGEEVNRNLAYLERLEKLGRRVQEEIASAQSQLTWSQRWTATASKVRKLWDYELYANSEYTLTVGKIGIALLILLLGIIFSRQSTRSLRRRVFTRLKLDEGVAAALEKGVYYILLVFVVLFALQAVNIPLTIFTVFGGGLAIGVGFGARNIINNFISGLLLMVERPIRIGDIVEVDGQRGRIVNIGARCSQLHLFSGVDILVPNSTILEKNLVNWTLTDRSVRFSIRIGVPYGSSTRDVERRLMNAVQGHAKVHKYPQPTVVFAEFGDAALFFEVFFWLELGDWMEAQIVCSDIRFAMDKLLREAGIIATRNFHPEITILPAASETPEEDTLPEHLEDRK
ncbi:MAG: mechanosensitive ion channel [Candidatus Hydrogenedentes bacterium]|nr:mechanosensitive ion channel [Candidatus Hydrogenedentota bacterium]